MKNIVVIGGGTGTFTVLSGLKKFEDLNLTAIVSGADSGGSTGRLRDEFGYLPMGDFRMALVALADTNGDSDILRELFLYRFEKGSGLRGHNFGNLFLTALTDILDSEDKAFEYASKTLRIKGKVLPITKEPVTLIAEYEDGKIIIGETHIDEPPPKHDGKQRIVNLSVQPKHNISELAKEAILSADLIIMGPGDLYTSTIVNLVVPGVKQVIKESSAQFVYAVNLINKYGQTYGMKASEHVDELKKYLGLYPDHVLVNRAELPEDILIKYEEEYGYPVEDDLKSNGNYKVTKRKLLAGETIKRQSGDVVKRSLIRHDSDKLADVILKLINSD